MAAPVERDAVSVKQQLAVLNAEAQRLEAKLDQAYQDLRAAQSDDEKAICKQRYDDLKANKKDLDQRRATLESQLSGQAGSAQPMTVPPDVVAARARTASRYVNFMLGDDGKPHAVVTLDQRRLITYGHGGHGQLREGSTVQVYLNNPEDDKPAPAKATVKFIKTQLDLVILEVDRELDPPPLDADVHPGEPYIMLAYSTTSASSRQEFGKPLPEDHASVSHGSIATSVPDKNGCIRGDTPPSPGNSGGGVFSLETGKLLGMCIGREKIKGRDGQYKDGFKSVLVPVAGVLMLLS